MKRRRKRDEAIGSHVDEAAMRRRNARPERALRVGEREQGQARIRARRLRLKIRAREMD